MGQSEDLNDAPICRYVHSIRRNDPPCPPRIVEGGGERDVSGHGQTVKNVPTVVTACQYPLYLRPVRMLAYYLC